METKNKKPKHPHARFTYGEAESIRHRVRQGEKESEIAREYGVASITIYDLVGGFTYAAAPGPIKGRDYPKKRNQ